MKNLILVCLIFLNCSYSFSQEISIDRTKIIEDLDKILSDISQNYSYLEEKKVDLQCIRDHYEKQIQTLSTRKETVLLFEYLLDEFYDSHLTLNTNTNSSYRLYAPLYAVLDGEKIIISNIWQSQLKSLNHKILEAEIEKINGINFNRAIADFPTHCNDKNTPLVRQWIANKLLAGRYDQPRVLTLKLKDQSILKLDLDNIQIYKNNELLSSKVENEVGVIRINNSLGNNNLVTEFDHTLNTLMNTHGLIIDLRNTVDGGNSYVARGIMGRFINNTKPYQKHLALEQYDDNPIVERAWLEFVKPRGKQYSKPVVILVGRWTGSMGEGLAIGFEGMGRAKIVGTEMERLAGEINEFSFNHLNFGYRISTAKLFHVNGTLREKYVPQYYVEQSTTEKDEILEKGLELIK